MEKRINKNGIEIKKPFTFKHINVDLTVEEVIEVGKYIGVPDEVVNKAPDDGLSGLTDEEKLGVKYSDIAAFLNNEKINKKEAEKIERLHNRNLHKFNTPTYRK